MRRVAGATAEAGEVWTAHKDPQGKTYYSSNKRRGTTWITPAAFAAAFTPGATPSPAAPTPAAATPFSAAPAPAREPPTPGGDDEVWVPQAKDVLQTGDTVLVIGRHGQEDALRALLVAK